MYNVDPLDDLHGLREYLQVVASKSMAKVVLVTGGHGLVGRAIQHVINDSSTDEPFRAAADETWHFVGSSDADLRLVAVERSPDLSLMRSPQRPECYQAALREVQTNSCHPSGRNRFVSERGVSMLQPI